MPAMAAAVPETEETATAAGAALAGMEDAAPATTEGPAETAVRATMEAALPLATEAAHPVPGKRIMKNHPLHRKKSSRRGMALVLVIAVVALLSAIVIGLRVASQGSWDESKLDAMRFQARLVAESGANLALHPDVKPGDPVLTKDFGDGRSFEVIINTESGRVLVNDLANEKTMQAVTELFLRWGLDATQAAIAAESLADWVDADSEARGNGAEQPFYAALGYPRFPSNSAFSSLETLLLVRGMDEVERRQPLWRDYFTLYGDGLIDLNSAQPEVIEAFLGVTREAAQGFLSAVSGSDGLPNTADDQRITDSAMARQLLGMTQQEWDEKSAQINLASSLRRVESTGRVGDHAVRIVVISEVGSSASGTTATQGSAVARFEE